MSSGNECLDYHVFSVLFDDSRLCSYVTSGGVNQSQAYSVLTLTKKRATIDLHCEIQDLDSVIHLQ